MLTVILGGSIVALIIIGGVILLAIAWLTRLASRRAAHVSAHHEARAEAA